MKTRTRKGRIPVKHDDKREDHERQSEPGLEPWQMLRLAQLEHLGSVQTAQLDYQRLMAEAALAYRTFFHKLVEDAWKERLDELRAGREGDDGERDLRELDRNRQLAHGFNDATMAAYEANSRAWFNLRDSLQSAYAKYMAAVYDAYRAVSGTDSIPTLGGMVAVGDESSLYTGQLQFNPWARFWNAIAGSISEA
jgi:hypothetical protein